MKRQTEMQVIDQQLPPITPVMIGQTPAGDNLLVRALTQRLPPPGANWPVGERQQWLDAMRQAFSLIYRDKS